MYVTLLTVTVFVLDSKMSFWKHGRCNNFSTGSMVDPGESTMESTRSEDAAAVAMAPVLENLLFFNDIDADEEACAYRGVQGLAGDTDGTFGG